MASVSVILHGIPSGQEFETGAEPVLLQFDEDGVYDNALWIIPGAPGELPAYMLSELRVQGGPVKVNIAGPEGFNAGPYDVDWVRADYPRGTIVSLLRMNAETKQMTGQKVSVQDGKLVLDELKLGGGA